MKKKNNKIIQIIALLLALFAVATLTWMTLFEIERRDSKSIC
jgi:hypothetical protein